jgi:hypothetical protein
MAQGDATMMPKLNCPQALIEETLAHLRTGGANKCETVVLWLGTLRNGIAEVREVCRPEQQVAVDFFRIGPESMRSLMGRIKETRFQILAQVHSHPEEAFHSIADDTWAIVRHVGAVSIVIPHFAKNTVSMNFGGQAATFQLSSSNRWAEVKFVDVVEVL